VKGIKWAKPEYDQKFAADIFESYVGYCATEMGPMQQLVVDWLDNLFSPVLIRTVERLDPFGKRSVRRLVFFSTDLNRIVNASVLQARESSTTPNKCIRDFSR
jgi:hypothetical protein